MGTACMFAKLPLPNWLQPQAWPWRERERERGERQNVKKFKVLSSSSFEQAQTWSMPCLQKDLRLKKYTFYAQMSRCEELPSTKWSLKEGDAPLALSAEKLLTKNIPWLPIIKHHKIHKPILCFTLIIIYNILFTRLWTSITHKSNAAGASKQTEQTKTQVTGSNPDCNNCREYWTW